MAREGADKEAESCPLALYDYRLLKKIDKSVNLQYVIVTNGQFFKNYAKYQERRTDAGQDT